MKIKIFLVCLFILPTQLFAKEECVGNDVSKWNNCIGNQSTSKGNRDLEEYVTSRWSKGPYKDGKKNGFFKEGLWVSRHDISSDGYEEAGHYVDGVRQGLWGMCYMRQVSYTYFQIGNYNEQGQRDGLWGEFNSYEQDFMDGSNGKYSGFYESGCHVKTALYYLNKKDPCNNKKSPLGGSNLFTNIYAYKDGEVVGSGGFCNHPTLDTTGEYKNTWYFEDWVELLENYEN